MFSTAVLTMSAMAKPKPKRRPKSNTGKTARLPKVSGGLNGQIPDIPCWRTCATCLDMVPMRVDSVIGSVKVFQNALLVNDDAIGSMNDNVDVSVGSSV